MSVIVPNLLSFDYPRLLFFCGFVVALIPVTQLIRDKCLPLEISTLQKAVLW